MKKQADAGSTTATKIARDKSVQDEIRYLVRFLVLCAVMSAALVACQPSPDEVTESALGQETLTEQEIGDATVSVERSGPAAWTCRRYLAVSDETSGAYDLPASEQAEQFVLDHLRAQRDTASDGEMNWPNLPVRSQLRDLCSDDETMLLSDAASQMSSQA